MQKQRQQLHDRQAAAFEQLRAVALVKVRATLSLSAVNIFDSFVGSSALPAWRQRLER
jgi:hypothetical protein